MKPPTFDYARPRTLAEAFCLLEMTEDAKILAGGQSLLPILNFRLAAPTLLMDINHLPGLDRIALVNNELRLGSLVRWREVKTSAIVANTNPVLAEAVRHVAHYQIRNRGTVGGSCAHADPAAELPAVAMACGAEFVLKDRNGTRRVAAEDFFQGPLRTVLKPTEILTEIRFPPRPARCRWGFEEFATRRGDFALLGVVALVEEKIDRSCAAARIVAFGTADGAKRLKIAETALEGRSLDQRIIREAAAIAAGEINVQNDLHASADYRRALTRVLVERALDGAFRHNSATIR